MEAMILPHGWSFQPHREIFQPCGSIFQQHREIFKPCG
jgi:hypothetical protein